MAIYMKYPDIDGTVETEGFADWIEVNSFQWGTGRGIASPIGGSVNREASQPSVSEVTVTKQWDAKSSSKLLQASLKGALDKEVTFKFTTTNADKVETFLALKLEGTGISGFSVSSGGDKPSESLSLNFVKFEYSPFIMKSGLDPSAGAKVSYDLSKVKGG